MSRIAKGLLMTFTGFVAGDVFSFMLLHPGKKHDWGILNKYLGRKVESKWWNTRLEHAIMVPGYLAVAATISGEFWGAMAAKKGKTFGLAQTPLALLFHCYTAIAGGLLAYGAHNAYLNPTVNDPVKFMKDFLEPSLTGTLTMLAFPFHATLFGKLAAATPALGYLWNNVCTSVIAFYLVKGVGWKEWHVPEDLTDLELRMNGYKEDK